MCECVLGNHKLKTALNWNILQYPFFVVIVNMLLKSRGSESSYS